jgi:hypothetical protein
MGAAVEAVDARHASFLRAGAARYIVPVTPGYEERVVRYLEAEGTEVERLGPPPEGFEPQDPVLLDLWLELLLDRRPELGLGSGTLDVTQGSANVSINTDSNWRATDLDVGRELFIDGGGYEIIDVTPHQDGVAQQLTLDDVFGSLSGPHSSPGRRTRRSGLATPARPASARRAAAYAAFALVAYMSTYSCPDSRMTSDITESVTARRT